MTNNQPPHDEIAERAANDPDLPDLIARCLGGDQSAFAALYERYAPALYRLAYSVLRDTQDAEDVLQHKPDGGYHAHRDFECQLLALCLG